MSKSQAPTVLKIPFHWLKHSKSIGYLLSRKLNLHRKEIYSWIQRFTFCCDEKTFVLILMRSKPNYWVFRCNQQKRCGDFTVVDMSSPNPEERRIWVLDLKLKAPLKIGGGGAGIQLSKASSAVLEIANSTGIVSASSSFELLSGDRIAILSYLGVPFHSNF